MNSQPWMKWYPADWRKDPNLQSCGIGARGLWAEMLWIMHESPVCGKLLLNQKVSLEANLANLVGITEKECQALKQELEDHEVFSRDENGVIFSRRMVRDHRLSEIRRKAGSQGGNPVLLNQKVIQEVKQEVNPEVKVARARADSSESEDRRQETEKKSSPKSPGGLTTKQKVELLYKAYPRKVARKKAEPKIEKALAIECFAILLYKVKEFAKAREGAETKYTAHPDQWFKHERWNDDPKEWIAWRKAKDNGFELDPKKNGYW